MGKMERYTDDELLALLREESTAAFVEIYQRYWRGLYTAASRRVKSRELAEEMIQDLFTGLWMNRSLLQVNVSLQAYLYTSIRNQVLNHFEKEDVRKRYREQLKATATEQDHSMEEAINSNDLSGLLARQVARLPSKCREVYLMSRQQHIPNREIAARMQISEKTVESHLTKALKILKGQLKDALVSLFL
ncbi:hypothetical protein DF182_04340 [Chitinophaga flava]|uniref:RNA polymerase sigma-70 factor n=2 Tax=Chitinophaga flava TaxID=2259036 RepID=A0A365Y0J4_9BACT|nr:hypothetical protein DF182_04340 [Chitinophaga flava]